MVLTKLALTCALLTAGQTSSDVVFTNLRSGRIPPDINPSRLAEIRELQLYMSPDRGKTWNQVDKITPDKDGFNYLTPSDGEFWYHVVITNQQGKQEPADLYKTPPMMKLMVDTKAPELKITSAQRQGDDLVVSWTVREDNPDPPKLKLDYRTADSTLWTPIPLTPGPNGTAKTRVNTAAPLVVRLQFRDLANNAASVETQLPGNVAAAGYNSTGAHSSGPDVAQANPPAAPTAPAVPPPPPAASHVPGPDLSVPPPVDAPRQAAQPQVPIAKPAPIATSSDLSQGSPVPIQSQNPPAPRGMPELQILNEPEIVVEYEVSKVGPSGLAKIEVWITRDGGANWARFAEDPDATLAVSGGKYQRTLKLPDEGVYGISLVVKSKAGMGRPAPRPGDVPEMLVEVDTTAPKAQVWTLVPDTQRRDTVILSWTATDRNLTALPITLEWADRPAGPWRVIGDKLPNTGRHPWQLPPSLPSHVFLRLTVRDSAGNIALAVTPEAQLVDLSEPEGRLIRVMPANKR